MSTSELKLRIFREIDQLNSDQLKDLQVYLHKILTPSKSSQTVQRIGAMKGTLIYMAPDFDEPLEDFQEYM